jgi:hypothetical protein
MQYSKMQNVTRVLLRFASFQFERKRCDEEVTQVREEESKNAHWFFFTCFFSFREIQESLFIFARTSLCFAVLGGEVKKKKKIKKKHTLRR